MAIKIIDICEENEAQYFCCLEEWSDDIKEAGDYKRQWYRQMKDKGVRVKFATDDSGAIGGMIQYMPIEHSMFDGKDIYVVLCIWVHGHKKGRGNFQKRGMGSALLEAAEDDCRELGAKGLAAWGVAIPAFMRASWFKRKGYTVTDKNGIMRLLWKPFTDGAALPRYISPVKKPGKGNQKVDISIFRNGWCPAMNLVYERAKRAAKEFEVHTEVKEYETSDQHILREWGISDALFIDGKEMRTGPPPSYERIRKKIEKRVRRKL